MDISLFNSLWLSFIQIIIALFLSTTISLYLGWICTKNHRIAEFSENIFRWLAYSVAIIPIVLLTLINEFQHMPALAIAVFICSLMFTTLYAIIGFQQARQNQNQWHLAIPNISLGMRIGLLLSLPALQIETMLSNRGISSFIWDAYSSGNGVRVTSGLFGIVILAFLLDQFIDIFSLFLSKALNSNRNSHNIL